MLGEGSSNVMTHSATRPLGTGSIKTECIIKIAHQKIDNKWVKSLGFLNSFRSTTWRTG